MIVISVGPPEPLARALPRLGDVLAEPLVTLERIAQVKHDGELLEPVPTGLGADVGVWQTIRVYTRRSAEVDGGALYSELTRRLREAGAAGATTILGDWGFSSDERPHGDKLGRITSHRPTYTVYIDRPHNVAALWPLVDELTAEHGIVTSLLVPGYRERAGGAARGSLDVRRQLQELRRIADGAAHGPRRASPAVGHPWLRGLLDRVDAFAASLGGREPVVRIALADGERFFAQTIEPGPGEDFLTLHPHPERHADPRRVLVVPVRAVAKVELLASSPRGTRSLVTFQPPPV
jgi:PII-like signaling protein